jgi:hypothetical protein
MNPLARCFVLLTLGLAGALVGGLGPLNYQVDPCNRVFAICYRQLAIGYSA